MNKKLGVMPGVLILGLFFLLGACGNKGDLYIPKAPQEATPKENNNEQDNQSSDNPVAPSAKADAIP